jgi:hypothetical protein
MYRTVRMEVRVKIRTFFITVDERRAHLAGRGATNFRKCAENQGGNNLPVT